MSHVKKKFDDLTPEELTGLIGHPVYVGITEKDTGTIVYQVIGIAVNIQSSTAEKRGLVSLADGENTTPVTWDTDQLEAEFVWESYAPET